MTQTLTFVLADMVPGSYLVIPNADTSGEFGHEPLGPFSKVSTNEQRRLFHGTSPSALASILAHGVRPSASGAGSWLHGQNWSLVYWAPLFEVAATYPQDLSHNHQHR